MTDERIAISGVTTAALTFEERVAAFGRAPGVEGIGVWRDSLDASNLDINEAASRIDDEGLEVSSLAFASGFTSDFETAIADAKIAIEDAKALRAPVLLLLGGPRLGVSAAEGDRLVAEALDRLAPIAQAAGVTLGLEPLHPVDATRFSTVVTFKQALDLVAGVDGVGIVFDTWNTWWDPAVYDVLGRINDNIAAVHVADWRHPSDEPRDRAVPGQGVAPLRELLTAVENTGYEGWYEVELFTGLYMPDKYTDLVSA